MSLRAAQEPPWSSVGRAPWRKLRHPLSSVAIAVCSVIGLGVGVMALTGNARLTAAPAFCELSRSSGYGPPNARFHIRFPGRPFAFNHGVPVPNRLYVMCEYSAKLPRSVGQNLPVTGS